MKYHVHLFPIVRVRVTDIEADSMEQAIDKAEAKEDFNKLFKDLDGEVEWAEEISHSFVDVDGDEEYNQSTWFGPDKERGLPDAWPVLRKILSKKELLPMLLGIDDQLDTLIAAKLKGE